MSDAKFEALEKACTARGTSSEVAFLTHGDAIGRGSREAAENARGRVCDAMSGLSDAELDALASAVTAAAPTGNVYLAIATMPAMVGVSAAELLQPIAIMTTLEGAIRAAEDVLSEDGVYSRAFINLVPLDSPNILLLNDDGPVWSKTA